MKLRVRINKRMHKEAREAAKEARISVNALIREGLWTMLMHRRMKGYRLMPYQAAGLPYADEYPEISRERLDEICYSEPCDLDLMMTMHADGHDDPHHGATREWCRRVVNPVVMSSRILPGGDTPEQLSGADGSQGRTGAERVLADA